MINIGDVLGKAVSAAHQEAADDRDRNPTYPDARGSDKLLYRSVLCSQARESVEDGRHRRHHEIDNITARSDSARRRRDRDAFSATCCR